MQQTNEPRTVLVRACQYLWLVLANGVHDDSLPLTMRRSLPPNPVMLGVPALSRDDCRRPRGRGSSVPAAPHRAVASAAYAGRLPAVERRVPLRSCVGTIIQATSCRTHLTQFSEVELFVRRLCRRSSSTVLSWLFRISCSICSRERPRGAARNTEDVPTVQTSPPMTLPQYVMSSGENSKDSQWVMTRMA